MPLIAQHPNGNGVATSGSTVGTPHPRNAAPAGGEAWKTFRRFAANAGTAIALIGLLFTAVKFQNDYSADVRTRRDAEVREWAAAAVFALVEAAGENGIDFASLKNHYFTSGLVNETFDVPKSALNERTLRQVVVGLMGASAISVDPESQRFLVGVRQSCMPSKYQKYILRQLSLQRLFESVFQIVSEQQGKLTVPELYQAIVSRFPEEHLLTGEYLSTLSQMVSMNALKIVNGKLSTVWDVTGLPESHRQEGRAEG